MSRILVFRQPASFQFYSHKENKFKPLLWNHCPSTNSLSVPSSHHASSYYQFLLPRASLSGSDGASYSERLLDEKSTKKKIAVAGVDQDELLDPRVLADPDSCFCEFEGVTIHHKVYNAESSQTHNAASLKLHFPIILLHGFGASVFSWSRAMKPLAQLTASKVLAFDRPAFGLTSRLHSSSATKSLNPYSMAFSVLATLYFIDFLAAPKAVIVGHSAGSLVAVNAYFEDPERIAALILVAPAIFAPYFGQNKSTKKNQTEGDKADSNSLGKPFTKLLEILLKFIAYITEAITRIIKGMVDMLNSWYKKALSAVLCSAFGIMLVRMLIDRFGIAAVRSAWYDSSKVTEHVLNGYTKPLKAKGWDRALAKFTAATLASTESVSKPPLSKRLHEISCPVLIITGDSDRIVPSWNARRLSEAIPGSFLEVIKHCGHLPHEEKVEEFVSIVEKFLRNVYGDAEDMSLQGVS